ncbi:hypothetical protein [Sphingomonas sp. 3-13AW]|uniref:hypothetical protein n=1 Tax=Sphingomonas sp. 3-13AW TaxID=3050450 RepID=UPI003BB69D5F
MAAGLAGEAPGVVASPERLAAWLATAAKGDEFVYATRCALPVGCAAARVAREAFEAGLVTLFQRRLRDRPERNYVARRTASPLPVRGGGVARAGEHVHVDNEAEVHDRVLVLLTRAARFQRPCPTNAAIARRAGITLNQAKGAVAILKKTGLIRVEWAPAPTLRRVTIVGTGLKTGMVRCQTNS